MPKVSVIIPAYNAMKFLEETVASVLSQTFDNFEVIIVNDGSYDGIENWVSQLIDSRVKLISQENQGLAAARNTGITHARGEYLAFLDADDIWEPTKLEKQVLVLDNYPEVGLVYTWVTYVDEQGKSTGRALKHQVEGNVWQQLTQYNIVECGSVAMVRHSCFKTVGVFDNNLSRFNVNEDWDMWLRIAKNYPFKVVKESLVNYRQISSSMSRKWQTMEQSYHIVIEKTFASAPSELLYLRGKSYSIANLCLAWKALQSKDRDYDKAIYFSQQAIAHYPTVCFSKEYIRLSIAITAMQWFGNDFYKKFIGLFHGLRRRITVIVK